jgi:uncharacterized protein YnzC (UPF0291/DUF896 family)
MRAAARTFESLKSRKQKVPADEAAISAAYRKLGLTPEGQLVLAHLRQITIEYELGPDATDSALRELEAQRRFVREIERKVSSDG